MYQLFYVGVFYYILGNIRPMFRSTLQAVQLLAVAKSSDIDSSSRELLLNQFMECMKVLAKVSIATPYYLTLDSPKLNTQFV